MAAVTQLNLYPLKSAAGISVEQAFVFDEGLLGDRRFMVAKLNGGFISARTHPQLQRIHVSWVAGGLDLNTKGLTLNVRYTEFLKRPMMATVWEDTFSAFSTHPSYDAWFSALLDEPVQLLWLGETSGRYRTQLNTSVSFADGYPLLLISTASLADVNLRADAQLAMSQFRPNIVVSAQRAFEEDGWQRIRIGEVEFVVAKPCSRCVMTTIIPGTEQFHQLKEPLATLVRYRRGEDGEVYFGQNLIALNSGTIQRNDPVEVLEYASAPIYTDLAPKRRELICVAREALTPDIETYWFKARDNKALASYLAGQHLPIALDINGQRYLRYYSLSSSPTRPEYYAISVKRRAQGVVSNWLAEHFKPGHFLLAHDPSGDFTLQPAHRYLFISAGSGVTPLLSMVRALADLSQLSDVYFLHVCKTAADIPAPDELAKLAGQNSGLKIQFILSQGEKGEGSRLDLAHLAAITELAQRQTYLCGPAGFMQQARAWLLALGLPSGLLHQEYFASPQVSDVPRETQTLTIDINGHRFTGNNQVDLLTQAEQQGLTLPWSCRAGICGSCKQQLISGEVEQPPAPALTSAEQAAGKVLACCCVPLTDVTLL
ncbi:hybrid-cluster NAD(P)-dependent oxidoreductase [Oceanisphaera avium]|uniref:Flavodoxin n=1 Tax=Oceanisphaera avium TaxID=1903694 RepID=A0A1Y0D037_9GAMM|nr:hybrid-cluster NAD(P)-dependent oxidoreductase [Oceanisphaera avium]ART80476.1 flavodoxin [Oceanisphaera avium]